MLQSFFFLIFVLTSHYLSADKKYKIVQISQGPNPSMHAYMDICPEDTTGKRVVYFTFAKKNLQKGKVHAGRVQIIHTSDKHISYSSPLLYANSHNAAKQRWLDRNRIAYQIVKKHISVITSLATGKTLQLAGRIEEYYAKKQLVFLKRGQGKQARSFVQYDLAKQTATTVMTDAGAKRLIPGCLQNTFCSQKGHLKNLRISPDGKTLFISFRAKKRSVGKKKKLKIFFFIDRKTGKIRYMGHLGQHPLWYNHSAIHYYSRHSGIDFSVDPRAQDVLSHYLNGKKQIVFKNALGIHGSFNHDKTKFVTDIFHWPRKNRVSILLYNVPTSRFRILNSYSMEKGKAKRRVHPHPAWCHKTGRIYFNAAPNGVRQLYSVQFP
ncbi:MAG: hypothetical protein AAF518_05625 [Spirochaetota bacterium]